MKKKRIVTTGKDRTETTFSQNSLDLLLNTSELLHSFICHNGRRRRYHQGRPKQYDQADLNFASRREAPCAPEYRLLDRSWSVHKKFAMVV